MAPNRDGNATDSSSQRMDNNYDRSYNAAYLLPVEIIFLLLSSTTWILRLYGRLLVLKTVRLDDAIVTFAVFGAIGIASLHLSSLKYGLGYHSSTLSYGQLYDIYHMEFFAMQLFLLTSLLGKLSVLCFYLQIATETRWQRFRRIVVGAMVFLVVWTAVNFTSLFFMCHPLREWWRPLHPGEASNPNCWNETQYGILYGTQTLLHLTTDIFVYLLPMKLLLGMMRGSNLKWGDWVRMLTLPGLGMLACLAAMARLYPMIKLFSPTPDDGWNTPVVYVLIAVEVNLVILCACLPFCKTAVASIRGILRSNRSSSTPNEESAGTNSSSLAPEFFQQVSSTKSKAEEEPPEAVRV